MLATVARLVSRRPLVVVLAWAGLAGALALLAPALRSVLTQDETAFLSGDAPSVLAAERLSEAWPDEELLNSAAVVFRRDSGLREADEARVGEVESWLHSSAAPQAVRVTQSAYSSPELRDVLLSHDGKVTILLVGFTTPPFQPETNAAVETIRERARSGAPDGLEVHVTGNAGVAADEAAAIDRSIHRTTIITLFLVTAILVWVYRSPVAPLVPLVTIGIAFVVARGLIALLAAGGLKVSSLVETFMVVIIFGAGTDYCLFIVSRFKEELAGAREGSGDFRRTLIGTMAVTGAVIASSAATVIVGFASQGVARFGMFRTTGPAMAVAVVVTLAAGLTLTPALLAALGPRAFWPWRADRPHAVATSEEAVA